MKQEGLDREDISAVGRLRGSVFFFLLLASKPVRLYLASASPARPRLMRRDFMFEAASSLAAEESASFHRAVVSEWTGPIGERRNETKKKDA